MVAAVGAFSDRGGLAGVAGSELLAGPVGFAVVPGRLDQQLASVAVAGLGDRPLAAPAAAGLLAGHQAQPGPDGGPGEALPIPNLHRQPEGGEHSDPTQAAQPGNHRRPGRRRRQLTNGRIQAVTARLDGQHRPMGLVKGDPQPRLVQLPPDTDQTAAVRLGPGGTGKDQP